MQSSNRADDLGSEGTCSSWHRQTVIGSFLRHLEPLNCSVAIGIAKEDAVICEMEDVGAIQVCTVVVLRNTECALSDGCVGFLVQRLRGQRMIHVLRCSS